jgi:photosystem II stability/assembly factor-like uncharacterized protein
MRPRLYLRGFLPFLITTIAAAQEPAVLSNHGDPMRMPYACAEEELAAAGMSCTSAEPCAVYLELGAVAANGSRILAAGDLHGNSATLESVLLLSEDSGATWKEPTARLRGATIDQLEFNGLAVWAAGESLYPLPRDPFVLLTTDGGASWRKQPIGEEDNPGSVQRFWFDSPQHGELIVDAGKTAEGGRYRAYESDNGGASWNLTGGSDRPPKLKHAPPDENQEWRVATSKDGKAVGIERHFDGEWIPAASFAIEVAQCGK